MELTNDQERDKIKKQNDSLNYFSKELQAKNEELLVERNDKIRFKDLSEGYMKEVAKLEA